MTFTCALKTADDPSEGFRSAVCQARKAAIDGSPGVRLWFKEDSEICAKGWAVFGCCDAGYVPRLLVALLSVRKQHPEIDAFLFCADADPDHARTAQRHGIRVVDYDPSVEFSSLQDNGSGSWPRECFGHLVAWRLLLAKGYRRSFSIDGDVLCCRAMPLDEIESDPSAIACVCNGSVGKHIRVAESSGEALEALSQKWISHWGRSSNTGIVFWNHLPLEEQGFAERMIRLTGWMGGGLWIPSDQHLLALALAVEPVSVRWLDSRWNFTRGEETGRGRLAIGPPRFLPDSRVRNLCEIFLLHFFKPWELLGAGDMRAGTAESQALLRHAVALWISLAEEAFGEGWAIPLRCPKVAPDPASRTTKPPRTAWWVARVVYPIVTIVCQAEREWRRIVDFLKRRPVRDLSPCVLALFLPFLRPWPMIQRAATRKTVGGKAQNGR